MSHSEDGERSQESKTLEESKRIRKSPVHFSQV